MYGESKQAKKKSVRYLETEITDCECSELNLGPLREQSVLLTTELSYHALLKNILCMQILQKEILCSSNF